MCTVANTIIEAIILTIENNDEFCIFTAQNVTVGIIFTYVVLDLAVRLLDWAHIRLLQNGV